MFLLTILLMVSMSMVYSQHGPLPPKDAQNVLFLIVDDLRPEMNLAYGQSHLVTPNLDKFTKTALTFNHAYVQFSHCSPSRNSFMSGRSPQTTKVYNFIDHFREPGVGANWTALPEFFRKVGYYVAGGGKLYHPGHPPNNDMPRSWDNYFQKNGDDSGCRKNETIYSNVCPSEEEDSAFYDWRLANNTVAEIKKALALGLPFWIGAGFRRPHRVWHVPKRFYDLYPNNGSFPSNIVLAKHKMGPVGMPELAYIHNAWPGISYDQNHPIPDYIATLGRWGYYAATSFTDYNIGIVLDALEKLDIAKNTVVVVMGDHGWQLGEHGEWCKRTNFELGLRVPYIIRAPQHPNTKGKQTLHFAEALDLYRTLVGLAVPQLQGDIEPSVQGTDLSPLFSDMTKVLKNMSFSQMARCPKKGTLGPDSACNSVKLIDISHMGYSVRTTDWRYTAWLVFNGTENRAHWEDPHSLIGEELYSHSGDDGTDFDEFENENVANKHATVSKSLFGFLQRYFDNLTVSNNSLPKHHQKDKISLY